MGLLYFYTRSRCERRCGCTNSSAIRQKACTLSVPDPTHGIVPSTGNRYQILRSTACLDQPVAAQEQLIKDTVPGIHPCAGIDGNPGPVNQVLDPWYEMDDSSQVGEAIVSATNSIIANRDFYIEAPNQAAQLSPTFPFTGALAQQAVSSWSCSGATNHCVFTVPSTAAFVTNGYVVITSAATGTAHGTNASGPYQISSLSGTQITTTTNPGGFTDSAGAGGSANTIGTGHGTLANRPTTCTTEAGYWATDQGNWNQSGSGDQGELFVCTAPDTWTLHYTPYTYPHPLIAGGTTGTGATPNPPTGLKVTVQ